MTLAKHVNAGFNSTYVTAVFPGPILFQAQSGTTCGFSWFRHTTPAQPQTPVRLQPESVSTRKRKELL